LLTKGAPGSPHKRIDYIFISAPGRELVTATEHTLWPDGIPVPAERAMEARRMFHPSDHQPLLHQYTLQPALVVAAP
jgi:hypothetical protein